MEGLSGKIKFDGAGFRSDFSLDIVELKREGLVQVSQAIHKYQMVHSQNW